MSVRLSEKHGVNPSVEKCFFCQRDVGIVLFGRLKDDVEAPRSVTLNHDPCVDCQVVMSRGVILSLASTRASRRTRRTRGGLVAGAPSPTPTSSGSFLRASYEPTS